MQTLQPFGKQVHVSLDTDIWQRIQAMVPPGKYGHGRILSQMAREWFARHDAKEALRQGQAEPK